LQNKISIENLRLFQVTNIHQNLSSIDILTTQ
jgi:hypothetical protein